MRRVSEVLSTYFDASMIPADVLAHACRRGTRVHRACLSYASQVPPIFFMEADETPFYESFMGWFDRNVEKVFLVERRLYDNELKLTGQVDLICSVRLQPGVLCVIDLKTPQSLKLSWLGQLAAYTHLAEVSRWKEFTSELPLVAGSLRLDKDGGTAKLDWVSRPQMVMAWNAFRAKLIADNFFMEGRR